MSSSWPAGTFDLHVHLPPRAWSQEEEEAAAVIGSLPQAGAGTPPAELSAALRDVAAAALEVAPGQGEEVADAALLRQPKHVFVFSTAGKPIYAYRNDEAALAGLMATAEAILSVAHSKGHTLRHVRCVMVLWRDGMENASMELHLPHQLVQKLSVHLGPCLSALVRLESCIKPASFLPLPCPALFPHRAGPAATCLRS